MRPKYLPLKKVGSYLYLTTARVKLTSTSTSLNRLALRNELRFDRQAAGPSRLPEPSEGTTTADRTQNTPGSGEESNSSEILLQKENSADIFSEIASKEPSAGRQLCSKCGKWFATKGSLRTHRMQFHGEEPLPYVCNDCGKGFVCNAALQGHRRSHTGEEPFVCLTCGKCFALKSNLKTHTNIHTGEKKFMCTICNKTFLRKQAIEKHLNIHTRELFVCALCGRSFSRKVELAFHAKTHILK